MTTYNIYGNNSSDDSPPVLMTIVLDESNTDVVSVESDDPAVEAEAEIVLRKYIEDGFPASEAGARYAGSYGDVKEANPDGSLVETAPENEPVEAEPNE
jgi:hypothetical protein